ncbi:spore protease YyaC [Paenibacillus eucommiae]|uniref:Sporulation protein YyaC n=1 Tax=Paenibacillus eucommiae TaxID=1355755 RepID=A0ABS4J445_9BACL|nr:spore protease YyaC [Paenibacillus eucommiae]MBP1994609.1 putative sporulation protein YyaC [Paenibacillus eucommiae]
MKFHFNFDSNKDKEITPLKVPYTDSETPGLLSRHLIDILGKLPSYQPIVIICVGTDRSTGDSLGPLVGTHLRKTGLAGSNLFGTLNEPVHAMNLTEIIQSIHQQYHDPFIIAVDACLGQAASVGSIQINNGPLKPGAGVNKELPSVGNIHVTGVVNVGGFMEYFVLQNTRLNLVMNMAEIIGNSIYDAMSHILPYSASATAASISD